MEYKQHQLAGHPLGLFVLFFTEMWERFSYYGMRALFVLYLTSQIAEGGPAWDRSSANMLYAFYTGLVYLTPILGGFIADKYWGFKKSVVIGGLIMTLGHGVLALEPITAFYAGCILIVIGNGLFKPNISSMVGELYPEGAASAGLKDAGYTIFYMGINTGSFIGTLLCGYIGEKVGWHYGFGLAGIFMLIGTLQFHFIRKFFGHIGEPPERFAVDQEIKVVEKAPLTKVEKDRLIVIGILSFFTIFFWFAFEQAGSSMNLFARDYTERHLASPVAANAFKFINAIISLLPACIIAWLLYNLIKKIGRKYPVSIAIITIGILAIWALVMWMLFREFTAEKTEVTTSWFQTLNALFIVMFAPLFSWIWKKLSTSEKYNPSPAIKFASSFIFVAIGFLALVIGSSQIPQGAMTANVSMIWLVLAFLFHTLGELSISPVGLSYVSKLAPKRLAGFMFGLWFFCTFLGNFLAGFTASFMDKISASTSMSGFFTIFVVIPLAVAIIILILNKYMNKKMHGVK